MYYHLLSWLTSWWEPRRPSDSFQVGADVPRPVIRPEPEGNRSETQGENAGDTGDSNDKRKAFHRIDPVDGGASEGQIPEETITLVQNNNTLYFYPLDPQTRIPGSAFAAKLCRQRSNYINESAAKRLELASTKGTTHRLYWKWSEEPKPRPRWSTFTVVPEKAMNIEVALGTEWSVEEVRDSVSSSQQFQDQPLGRGGVPYLPDESQVCGQSVRDSEGYSTQVA